MSAFHTPSAEGFSLIREPQLLLAIARNLAQEIRTEYLLLSRLLSAVQEMGPLPYRLEAEWPVDGVVTLRAALVSEGGGERYVFGEARLRDIAESGGRIAGWRLERLVMRLSEQLRGFDDRYQALRQRYPRGLVFPL